MLQVRLALLKNPEYGRLADDIAEATKVEERYLEGAKGSTVVHPVVVESLTNEFEAAQQKKYLATKRRKEIEWEVDSSTRWHAMRRWKAEDYFDEKQVIALCHAVEDNDVPEMERLIAVGANANAIGKDGMTPLLWAFPDEKLERFECLLKHGADPNVVVQSDFRTVGFSFGVLPKNSVGLDDIGCHVGDSVTLLAVRSPVLDHLKLVLAHGGNPNQVNEKTTEALLDVALKDFLFDCDERVSILLAKGADPNRYCERHKGYPATEAVKINRYDAALELLKADEKIEAVQSAVVSNLTSVLADRRWAARFLKGNQATDYKALVEWLEQHGESLKAARERREK